MMNKTDARLIIEEMMREYAACIDDGRYEEWPEFFTDECRYLIISRESHERGHAMGYYLCESKGMLRDRIVCLRETSLYEPQQYRHLIGGTRIVAVDDSVCRAETGFTVIRTTQDGAMSIFIAGKYVDTLVIENDVPRFREKLVLTDSTRIEVHLAAPI
jgi:anthranilate 1,2-dioxygenase small subunit